MPRWRLALAPAPVACLLPVSDAVFVPVEEESNSSSQTDSTLRNVVDKPTAVADVLRDLKLDQQKKTDSLKPEQKNDASFVSPPIVKTIPAFTLSIWRPQNDLLVIDSRNAQLALPTELLLQNILRALYGVPIHSGTEDILRWPLIDNTFVSRTVDDARSVLQVWLEVELERRPVKRLLLMGHNASQYFLESENSYQSSLFQSLNLTRFSTQSIISPSLVELLQKPEQKLSLWQVLQSWRSAA